MKKVLALVGIGVILCGCQGPQIQKAVEALNTDTDGIAGQIAAGNPILTTVAELEKKAGEAKLSQAQKDSLLAEIGKTQTSIATITGLKAKVQSIRDSVGIMEAKATGKAKEDIDTLNAKLDELFTKIASFTDANMKLDMIRANLAKVEEKAPAKATIPPAPKKKVPAPEKM